MHGATRGTTKMTPVSPVIPGFKEHEVVFAKDQPEYMPLPALRFDDGMVITRWRLSFRERLQILFGCDIWLYAIGVFGALQPVKLTIETPEFK